MRLVVLGALPMELTYIVKNLGAKKHSDGWNFPVHVSERGPSEIVIVQTGIGMIRAQAALKALLERFRPDCIISSGFAGALYPDASPGDLVRGLRIFGFPSDIYESEPPESYRRPPELKPVIPLPEMLAERLARMTNVSEGSIITLERQIEKNVLAGRIPDGLPFPVCDMETFALAELSLGRSIPFLAVRSISDTLDDEVPPELAGVVDEMGQPKLGRLFHAVTTNPALVTDVLRLRRSSDAAAQRLGQFVDDLCRASQ